MSDITVYDNNNDTSYRYPARISPIRALMLAHHETRRRPTAHLEAMSDAELLLQAQRLGLMVSRNWLDLDGLQVCTN